MVVQHWGELCHSQYSIALFFWQDDLLSVSNLLCEFMVVMLGANSDDQGQTPDQPQVVGNVQSNH